MKKFYKIGKNILFPINRSLTGQGVIKTLKIIQKEFPKLKIKKIKSGTKVFDWNIPPEWNVKNAYVLDKNGFKIIDFWGSYEKTNFTESSNLQIYKCQLA